MSIKVREILLVSSPYDAFIMEEDGSLASRIINEYSGLNLSLPPRVIRTDSAAEALSLLEQIRFDLVITMPRLHEMDAFQLGLAIKQLKPHLPVILLSHSIRGIYPFPENKDCSGIDKIYIWSGNSDLLLALVKNTEDRLNIDSDTRKAMVRVLVLVEDSPTYYSTFLPLIYKEVVQQTQAVLGVGLNEEHRLLRMRSRPKILLAVNYDEASEMIQKYQSYLIGVISDTRFPRGGRLDDNAGATLLTRVRKEIPDLPLLLLSSDPKNQAKADEIPATFLNKNSPDLLTELHGFFLNHLGFGDFVFRMPDGTEIDRASNLRSLEQKVSTVPDESLLYHARRNHFSNWLMARSEIALASAFRKVQASDFGSVSEMRTFLTFSIHRLREVQQKGIVARFNAQNFDAEIMDFVKIGDGSLGGKARGLAFSSALLHQNLSLFEKYPDVAIQIPRTLVITTRGFESFIQQNHLEHCAKCDLPDERVTEIFLSARMPDWIMAELEVFLSQVRYPLAVRSSSLLEDAQYQPYAGLYNTYMIPNSHLDFTRRLDHLVMAIKRVYASTYYENPRAFSRSTMHQPQEESMAVVIQQLVGEIYGEYFYPALSGVAQSYNFYPFSPMSAEDGIAHIALGFGKTVVEGEKSIRFCPRYPSVLPQFSSVEDILANSQKHFYALKICNYTEPCDLTGDSNLEKREVTDAEEELPLRLLSGTYSPDEHRIRDSGGFRGHKILTFAQILKYEIFPLPELLMDMIALGSKGMGCPVEIEFAVNLGTEFQRKKEFFFLQMRPMAAEESHFDISIAPEDERIAICVSGQALGNGKNDVISDVVYIKPESFALEATSQMAEEIGRLNTALVKEKRPYLLIGPGRWGSADRWLGIPVQWRHISGVGAIVELRDSSLKVESSQGSHFLQNITSLGIPYITISDDGQDKIDWSWFQSQQGVQETAYVRHIRALSPLTITIDGRNSRCVILP